VAAEVPDSRSSAPVLTLNEAIAHPHMRERKTVRRVSDEHLGQFDIPGMPVKFSGWQVKEDVRADLLGEHNEDVLANVLGMSEKEIAALYEDRVLVRDVTLSDMQIATPASASTTDA
jgi:CoA:oxalate CoA-transferase